MSATSAHSPARFSGCISGSDAMPSQGLWSLCNPLGITRIAPLSGLFYVPYHPKGFGGLVTVMRSWVFGAAQ